MQKRLLFLYLCSAFSGLTCTDAPPKKPADQDILVSVPCPADKKQCPDGSFVYRKGPGCEFEECPDLKKQPVIKNTADPLKTYRDSIYPVEFRYPDLPDFHFISAPYWPPAIQVEKGVLSCDKSNELWIKGKKYCRKKETEGAAGSIYHTWKYSSAFGTDSILTLSLTFRFPQCANYEDKQQKSCTDEQNSFNAEDLATGILETLRIGKTKR